MCVVVADRTIDLAQQLHFVYLSELTLQAISHVGQLLAHCGGGRCLPVGAGQHGYVRPVFGLFTQRINQLHHVRPDFIQAALEHQGMRQVIDVL